MTRHIPAALPDPFAKWHDRSGRARSPSAPQTDHGNANPRHFLFASALAAALLALAAGCSTIESRIGENRPYYDSLPAADQAQIRIGKINLGFAPESVRMALGDPRQRLVRRTADGDSEIWIYTEPTQSYERQRADIDGITAPGPGGARYTSGSAWITVRQERERPVVRVEFRNGRAVSIETPAEEAAKRLADTGPAPADDGQP
jgi:hypothetical protein